MLKVLRLLKKIGLLNSYLLNGGSNKFSKVKISPFFYRNSAFFKNIRLVTTPSKCFNIRLRTLQIVCKSLGESIIILETSRGILTHKEALKLRVSGKILLVLS